MSVETIEWLGSHFPVIADLGDGYKLVAHKNGPSICDGNLLCVIDIHPDLDDDDIDLKIKAQKAFREWAWPKVKHYILPSGNAEKSDAAQRVPTMMGGAA